ncbi:DgyrCDS271 [Dimorphilus gyrociliatus]|nr:DgyrCDS271 [Dimorphilus gyrociliatus]
MKEQKYIGSGKFRIKVPKFLYKIYFFLFLKTIDPQNKLYYIWLLIVTVAFMYNCLVMTLRAAFKRGYYYDDGSYMRYRTTCDPLNKTNCSTILENLPLPFHEGYETDENRIYWWLGDYFCDFLYLMDILFVKSRIRFVKNGLVQQDRKECAKHYFKKINFKMDILCLTPTDLFYFVPAFDYNPLLRFPRMLKIHTFWDFFDRMDQAARSAHIVRVIRTLTYMVFLIHIEACGYYSMSAYEGLKRNAWVYDAEGVAYIRCIYLATKTATSIGNNPRPVNKEEWVFMTFYWLSGVFVFAILIGQIRDIFQSAGYAKTYYRKSMDQTIQYMKTLNLPKELQDRVRMWFNYNWEHQKTLNENFLLEALPKKMKADLAIHVHYDILSKVSLFQDCDKNLLYDLVLKLQPQLFLPNDYICRKGEVGTEMYIVMSGIIEVVGGPNNNTVFATLQSGSVFGEISLLALAGGNRRTADVRSKGFSQLFILCKADFEEAMMDYPTALKILKKRARRKIAANAKHEKKAKGKDEGDKMISEEVIKSRPDTPKLLKTVVRMVEPNSKVIDMLSSGMKKSTEKQNEKKDEIPDDDDEILVVEQTEIPIKGEKNSDDSGVADEPETDSKRPPSQISFHSETVSILNQTESPPPPVIHIESEPSKPPSGKRRCNKVMPESNDNDIKPLSKPSIIPPVKNCTVTHEALIHRERTPNADDLLNEIFEQGLNKDQKVGETKNGETPL